MKARTLIATLSLACDTGVPLHAQVKQAAPPPQPIASVAPSEPGSNLTVYLLTFGWGDIVWERFGHNAILIKDRAHGTDMTYNWCMFDFNQPNFVWRFVTGDTRYWMEPIDYNSMVTYYKQHNRSILAQELNLNPAQRLKLQQFVQWNALPQNKFYRYDYYRDNCSTRLRDAIPPTSRCRCGRRCSCRSAWPMTCEPSTSPTVSVRRFHWSDRKRRYSRRVVLRSRLPLPTISRSSS